MRALLSVYDKTGLIPFAQGLRELGWELVSSGGTSRALAQAGIAHLEVESVTGAPEMLDGRVKTLHPAIHGGILADRSKPEHMAAIAAQGINPIDLVVCNLYPFSSDPSIELIDIGGPAMVRSAAKNHAAVGIVVNPADYQTVLAELGNRATSDTELGNRATSEPELGDRASAALSDQTRRRLARKAFDHTASYDAAIVTWFDQDANDQDANDQDANDPGELPSTINLSLTLAETLRYGENPHQTGARYREAGQDSWWDSITQHCGIALSYLNLFDADAAWRLVHDLGPEPAAAIIKHANPCGAAVATDIATAYGRAFKCDPTSAFGGVVALNRPVTAELAEEMAANPKADVLIAPAYEPAALERFAKSRKNMRVIEATTPGPRRFELRRIDGGFLVQQPDIIDLDRNNWRVVTKAQPTDAHWQDLELAWKVCAAVSSNAVVLVANGQAVGIGAGQQSRIDSGAIAARKADGRAKGGVCASDAFYPFRDGLDAAAQAGVAAVIQPGGSMRDGEVIAAADEHGIAMVFTGQRHFRH